MNDEKKTIFVLGVAFWEFFGIPIYIMIENLFASIFVYVFVICGLAFIFILSGIISGTNFKKMFSYYKAQRKGKKYCGYIYKIMKRDKGENAIIEVLEMGLNIEQKEFVKILREVSGDLILKIMIYDDIKMETVLIEQKISVGTAINEKVRCNQYTHIYKYKDKYYMMPNCVIPKFAVSKNHRLEIKKQLNEMIGELKA